MAHLGVVKGSTLYQSWKQLFNDVEVNYFSHLTSNNQAA